MAGCCGQSSAIPYRGIFSVLGCMLIFFCFGNEHTFGNINPYMTSYLRNRSRLSPDVDHSDIIWVATGKTMGACVSMPILCHLLQPIVRILPSRICILLGVWISCLRESIYATVVTDGTLTAMGRALAQPIALRMALGWFPDKRGIVCGLTAACFGGSAVVFNQIFTHFINPDNYSPEQIVNDNRNFTQSGLLDRIPYGFLLIGGILAVLFTTGVILLKYPEVVHHTKANEKCSGDEKRITETTFNKDKSVESEKQTEVTSVHVVVPHDFGPLEVLMSGRFYLVFIMYFFLGFSWDIFNSLFKSFGETFILDDHFLSLVASFAAVASALGNLTWGFLADRFTCKVVFPIQIVVFGVFLSTFNTTEYGGKPMYFIWVCGIHFASNGVYVLLPLIVLDMFGSKHYPVNFGLAHSAGIAFSLLAAVITSQIKDTVGWHGMFLIAGSMPVISFVLSAVIYLKNWDQTR